MPNELKFMFGDELRIHDLNALVRTCREMNELLTRFMYRRAATLNKTRRNRPYFLLAVDDGNLTAVKQFLEVGADVNMTDKVTCYLGTAIHSCAHFGHVKMAEFLIEKGSNVSAVVEDGRGALHSLVGGERPEEAMVTLLVKAGADVEARWNMDTPLHAAACTRNVRIVQRLLDLGANPDAVAEGGARPLHFAASASNAATVRCLLEAGQNVQVTDRNGRTPLHKAALYGATESVEVLLDMGADVTHLDHNGNTPLMTALINRGNEASVHRIVHLFASQDGRFRQVFPDCVPSCLVEKRNHKTIEMLLAAGSDILRPNNNGVSALTWAGSRFPSRSSST